MVLTLAFEIVTNEQSQKRQWKLRDLEQAPNDQTLETMDSPSSRTFECRELEITVGSHSLCPDYLLQQAT
jgi:hypothetical protein